MNPVRLLALALSLSTLFLTSAAEKAAAPVAAIDYNRDIRPILTDNCFACHGPDSAARKADLRLDSFDAATTERKDSKPAIVPGKPDESSFIARIETSDEDDVMPPPKTKKVLKASDKELLRRWVAEGAKYQAHWSFLAPKRPELPTVKKKSWVSTPVDAFILAALEKNGLAPEAEGDRRTLARRLSLDLTGLPPTPELVEQFVKDKSSKAYENLVDRLMASEAYGEHRARYWLDGARYADTHGIHIDNYREVWSYRDWVINAFNANMPFDQFTIEQLAGDLLPNATMEQKIATGFNRCNITTSEGGAINEEYLVLYNRDRTETTAAVWMGLTAGCAVCHDHKYDPLSQKEFYQMAAFFNNTTQPAMDGNRKDTPPIVVVPTPEDRARWEEMPPIRQAVQARIDKRRETAKPEFEKWAAKATPATLLKGLPLDALHFGAPLDEGTNRTIAVVQDGYARTVQLAAEPAAQPGAIAPNAFTTSKENAPEFPGVGNFERDQSFTASLWVKLHADDKSGSVIARMDEDQKHRGWDIWFDDRRPGIHIVHDWPGNALKVVSRKALDTNRWTHIAISYDGSSKAEGVTVYIDGSKIVVDRPNANLTDTIAIDTPLKIGQRRKGDHLEKAGVQDVRLYSRALNAEEVRALKEKPQLAWILAKTPEQRSDEDKTTLYATYLSAFDLEFIAAKANMAKVDEEENAIKARGTIGHVMNEKAEEPSAYVLFRGEYDKRRDKVAPGTPAALPSFPSDFPRNRLGFAKWLLQPEHPLTARVTVNRMWQEMFGNGLVKSSGDFGITGDTPSNQDLLDWLAVEFRESGWNMRHIYKTIVLSSAYRQAAITTPEKLAKDPENRLISRGPRFRMDAEMIRDYALAASGLLTRKIGGPSVKPYQPEGVWEMVAMKESDTSKYTRDTGEKLYRRSLYTFWKRSAPPAMMDVLNAPSREGCTVRRERTNTPLQALATLNDEQFIEAARHLAERALREAPANEEARVSFIAERILSRELKPEERKIINGVLSDLQAHYKTAPEDAKALITVGESKPSESIEPVQLAALTMVANQLMNLDEALNK
ncbi:MAG TPA: DUF1553 domain-containing protein [Methylomirabilota bacterium]|nr:DUF1553 domain-containing protein [Methylomirabilota bacterium]